MVIRLQQLIAFAENDPAERQEFEYRADNEPAAEKRNEKTQRLPRMEDNRISAWQKAAHSHQEHRVDQVHAERHRAKLRQYFLNSGKLFRIDEVGGQEDYRTRKQCVCAPRKFDLPCGKHGFAGAHLVHHVDVIIDHRRETGAEQCNAGEAAPAVGEPSHHVFIIDAEKCSEEIEHEIREGHGAFSRYLKINRIQVHPRPLQGDSEEYRIFPDPAEFLEQIQQHREHQVKLDTDKNEIQMIARFACGQLAHERFKQQRDIAETAEKVGVQPEIEHGEHQIRDQDVQQPLLIELEKQLDR